MNATSAVDPTPIAARRVEYRLAFVAALYLASLLLIWPLLELFGSHCSTGATAPQTCRTFLIAFVAHPDLSPVLENVRQLGSIWTLAALIFAVRLLPPYRMRTLLCLGPVAYIGAAVQMAPISIPSIIILSVSPGSLTELQSWTVVGFLIWGILVGGLLLHTLRLLWKLLYWYRAGAANRPTVNDDGTDPIRGSLANVTGRTAVSYLRPLMDRPIDGVLAIRDVPVIVWWHQVGPVVLTLVGYACFTYFGLGSHASAGWAAACVVAGLVYILLLGWCVLFLLLLVSSVPRLDRMLVNAVFEHRSPWVRHPKLAIVTALVMVGTGGTLASAVLFQAIDVRAGGLGWFLNPGHFQGLLIWVVIAAVAVPAVLVIHRLAVGIWNCASLAAPKLGAAASRRIRRARHRQ